MSEQTTNQPHITQTSLEAGLRGLGLQAGMRVMVHSSLSKFGHVEGGAATVVETLLAILTPAGTLMMPSFNHGAPFSPYGPGYFDPAETPTTNGAIPDHFWRQPNVRRSLNPTHSFAVWGADADRYVSRHHQTLTMGPESPLGLLAADGGYGLLLGVSYRSNTFHHVVEMSTGAPCLGKRTEVYPMRLADGQQVMGRTWGWRAKPCPFTDGDRYGAEMSVRGLDQVAKIGASRCTLFKLQDCYDLVAEILGAGRDGFPPCARCPIRPRHVAATVPSDWNPA